VILIVRWIVIWFRRSQVIESAPQRPAGWARWAIIAGLVGAACFDAWIVAWPYFPGYKNLDSMRPFIFHLIVAGVSSLAIGIIVYCAAWQTYHEHGPAARRRRAMERAAAKRRSPPPPALR